MILRDRKAQDVIREIDRTPLSEVEKKLEAIMVEDLKRRGVIK